MERGFMRRLAQSSSDGGDGSRQRAWTKRWKAARLFAGDETEPKPAETPGEARLPWAVRSDTTNARTEISEFVEDARPSETGDSRPRTAEIDATLRAESGGTAAAAPAAAKLGFGARLWDTPRQLTTDRVADGNLTMKGGNRLDDEAETPSEARPCWGAPSDTTTTRTETTELVGEAQPSGTGDIAPRTAALEVTPRAGSGAIATAAPTATTSVGEARPWGTLWRFAVDRIAGEKLTNRERRGAMMKRQFLALHSASSRLNLNAPGLPAKYDLLGRHR